MGAIARSCASLSSIVRQQLYYHHDELCGSGGANAPRIIEYGSGLGMAAGGSLCRHVAAAIPSLAGGEVIPIPSLFCRMDRHPAVVVLGLSVSGPSPC